MLKQMAWNMFKKTGNIETFMELIEVKSLEQKIKAEKDGNNKDKRNYYI